jgi:hypothetical protein
MKSHWIEAPAGRSLRLLLPVLYVGVGLLLATALSAEDVRVNVGTIEDRRTTGQFFAGMTVEIALVGDELDDVRGARALVRKAVDETGRSLLPEEAKEPSFETPMGSGPPKLRLDLRNPERRATILSEVSGDIELYMPGRDPAARVRIEKVLSKRDRKLALPALRAAKIEAKVISPEAYRAGQKQREAEVEKEMEKQKQEMARQGQDTVELDALFGLAKGLSGLLGEVGENDLVLEVVDPESRVFGIQAVNARGEKIDHNGSMSTGNIRVLHFSEKLPGDAGLLFLLKTKKSLLAVPFRLKDVNLP